MKRLAVLVMLLLCGCLPAAGDPYQDIARGQAALQSTQAARNEASLSARATQEAAAMAIAQARSAEQATAAAGAAMLAQATLEAGQTMTALEAGQAQATLQSGRATMQAVQVTADLIALRAHQTIAAATPQPTEYAATQQAVAGAAERERSKAAVWGLVLLFVVMTCGGAGIVTVFALREYFQAKIRIMERRSMPAHFGDGVIMPDGYRFLPMPQQPTVIIEPESHDPAVQYIQRAIRAVGGDSIKFPGWRALEMSAETWSLTVARFRRHGYAELRETDDSPRRRVYHVTERYGNLAGVANAIKATPLPE